MLEKSSTDSPEHRPVSFFFVDFSCLSHVPVSQKRSDQAGTLLQDRNIFVMQNKNFWQALYSAGIADAVITLENATLFLLCPTDASSPGFATRADIAAILGSLILRKKASIASLAGILGGL